MLYDVSGFFCVKDVFIDGVFCIVFDIVNEIVFDVDVNVVLVCIYIVGCFFDFI